MSYDSTEQDVLMHVFMGMLWSATGDGGQKRAKGEKPPWWRDSEHEAAIFSHLNKWKHGEREDADSGAHPLVHLAWRALAIAYQQTYGWVDPAHPASPFSQKGEQDDEQDEGSADGSSVRDAARSVGWGPDARRTLEPEWGRVYGEPDPEPHFTDICPGGSTCHHY